LCSPIRIWMPFLSWRWFAVNHTRKRNSLPRKISSSGV
jgi:hypothetical protein